MSERLKNIFRDDDGLRQVILSGPSAGDLLYVDLATGALPMAEALEQEAMKRGFEIVLRVNDAGEISCATSEMDRRFRSATEASSRDPAAANAKQRPLPSAETRHAHTPGQHTEPAGPPGSDALSAAIGRIGRAMQKLDTPFFIHFTGLGGMLSHGTVASPRARLIFGLVGQLRAKRLCHDKSRLVVTIQSNCRTDGQALLIAHDHGATPWHSVDVLPPSVEEIRQFLDRAKGKHDLHGSVAATSKQLAQRHYTLTRISDALRGRIADGDRDITSVIGAEFDEAKLAEVRRQLDEMVGLTDIKQRIATLVSETRAIQDDLRAGKIVPPTTTHIMLLGRPGTGKTEVAHLIARLLHAGGVRRRDAFVPISIADIVGQHNSGEAIQNIRQKLLEAAGGVLFIDEAYALAENEWGRQAVSVLVDEMEKRSSDLTVILAGYSDRMQRLLNANEGLKGRIANIFELPDYSPAELCEIFDRKAAATRVECTPDARTRAHSMIRRESTRPHANGRDVRTHFDTWNRQRMVGRAERLEAQHVTDPRHFDPAEARALLDRFRARFVGMSELTKWMEQTLLAAKDSFARGQLPKAPRLLFLGPPGTGKTESARCLGSFLHACGVLRRATMKEISIQDLTSQFVGGAEERTESHFKDAAESVLFVDEAYRLADSHQGQQVLHQIVQHLTDPEFDSVCLILAGYEQQMMDLLKVNPALSSKLNTQVRFAWPQPHQLAAIALTRLREDYRLQPADEDRESVVGALERTLNARRSGADFAGARTASTVAEETWKRSLQAGREPGRVYPDDVPSTSPPPRLDAILTDFLKRFVGLAELERPLKVLLATMRLRDTGSRLPNAAFGLRITGDTGTGKTTLARWLLSTLAERPGASPAPFIEVSAQSLQGVHLGEAQANVRRNFETARGGCLFIDEFHALAPHGTQANLYSGEIAKEIVAQMTQPANATTTVILAGYRSEMPRALAMDLGLANRFPDELPIPPTTSAALSGLFYNSLVEEAGGAGGVSLATLKPQLHRFFDEARSLKGASFGNCRQAHTLVQRTRALNVVRGNGEPTEIAIEDILEAIRTLLDEMRP